MNSPYESLVFSLVCHCFVFSFSIFFLFSFCFLFSLTQTHNKSDFVFMLVAASFPVAASWPLSSLARRFCFVLVAASSPTSGSSSWVHLLPSKFSSLALAPLLPLLLLSWFMGVVFLFMTFVFCLAHCLNWMNVRLIWINDVMAMESWFCFFLKKKSYRMVNTDFFFYIF